MALTPLQAAAALTAFDRGVSRVVTSDIDDGLTVALRLSVTRFMVGGGASAPPNPPPGPLRIRSGNLRRGVIRVLSRQVGRDTWAGGLGVLASVPYAAIHEFGGRTGPHEIRPVRKQVLRWKGTGPAPRAGSHGPGKAGGGFDVFARSVQHPGSHIPARPYLTPAIAAVLPLVIANIERDLVALAERALGGR